MAVHTDFTKEEILNDDDLRQVFQDKGTIGFGFSRKDEYINSTLAAPLCSIYLLEENTEFCENKQQRQGRVVLNNALLEKNPSCFEDRKCFISKYVKGWADEKLISVIGGHHCNSLILIDPFISRENLKPLLNVLLPKKLDFSFHLSVFTNFSQNKKFVSLYKRQQFYEQIAADLRDIRPQLEVIFTLYDTCKIHDRIVLTNTYMIDVGLGFGLFKNGKAVKETTVDYSPKKDNIYYGWLKLVTEISRKSEANDNYANYWGSKENRLFDLVETEHTKAKEDMASTKVERPLINTSDVPKVDGVKIVGRIDLPADSQRRIR